MVSTRLQFGGMPNRLPWELIILGRKGWLSKALNPVSELSLRKKLRISIFPCGGAVAAGFGWDSLNVDYFL